MSLFLLVKATQQYLEGLYVLPMCFFDTQTNLPDSRDALPGEISGYFPRQPEATLHPLAVAVAGYRAGDVAQSTWRYTLRQTVCHCARWWRVRGPCTPSAYCGLTVWRRQLCSRCSVRFSSLSLLMPLRRTGALRPPSTDSVSMLFCTELFVLTYGHCLGSLRIRWRTSATQLMMNCLAKSKLLLITTFYMHSCHHHLSHQRTMVLDSVHTLLSSVTWIALNTSLSDCNFLMRMLHKKNSY